MWDERITIRNYANTTDGRGGTRKGTATENTIWAQVVEKNYSKLLDGGQTVNRVQYEIRVYKEAADEFGLTQNSRIIYRTRDLAIQSLKQTQDRFHIDLICTENA